MLYFYGGPQGSVKLNAEQIKIHEQENSVEDEWNKQIRKDLH